MNALEFVLILLSASVVVVALVRALGMPPVLGYLLVGALAGPHALQLLPDERVAREFADFGVVLLMFTIGLEFSLPRLWSMKRLVFGLGLLQVVITMSVAGGVALALTQSLSTGAAIGGLLAMSSTAMLSKLLSERRELNTAHGTEVIGVLLFQDLAVLPLLIIISALSRGPDEIAPALAFAALKTGAVLLLVLYLGQRIVGGWFRTVARRRSSELFMLNVLLFTLGLAYLTSLAGLSMALGSFIAGILISESPYRFQVAEDIKPFRDILLGLFFISIGMFLDMRIVMHQWTLMIGLLITLMGGKLLITSMLSRMLGATPGVALRTGMWLCSAGEFGFVLLAEASNTSLFGPEITQPLLMAMVMSLLLAPLIVYFSDRIIMRWVPSEWLQRSIQLTQVASSTVVVEQHAVLCGFGRTGQHLARFLEAENISYIALDNDAERVHNAAEAGESVVFGDCTHREILIAAGLQRAKIVVITFAELEITLEILEKIRAVRADLPVIVRTREQVESAQLYAAGAAEVIPEALESSAMLATHALALWGVPMHRVIKRLREMREQNYVLLRGFFTGGTDASESLQDAELPRLKAIALLSGAYAIGRSIDQLEISKLGASVSGVRRRGKATEAGNTSEPLLENDIIVVCGVPEALDAAERYILRGKPKSKVKTSPAANPNNSQ